MCYFSTTLPKGSFRNAKEGESLRFENRRNHMMAVSNDDNMIVCIPDKVEVHISSLRFNPRYESYAFAMKHEVGKSLTGQMHQGYAHDEPTGYSADMITMPNGNQISFEYFKPGLTFYIGPKKVNLVSALGFEDPSITLDHRIDESPVAMNENRVLGLCSVSR